MISIPVKQHDPLEDQFNKGVQTFYDLLESGQWIVRCATSFGKDSSVVLSMVLKAAALASRDGIRYPTIIVSHANTGIENPAVEQLVRSELRSVKSYCDKHKINWKLSYATPRLFESYLVRIIGGNRLPTYVEGPAQCSVELKVNVQNRQSKQLSKVISKNFPGCKELLVTGVRHDESNARSARIRERGDTDDIPFEKDGQWAISPLLGWSTEDVFMFIAQGAKFDVYSNMESVFELYADASGGGCAVVGDVMMDNEAGARKGCSARHGCAICCRTGETDKSMEAMIELDHHKYMKELNDFRNYLLAIRFDLSKRRYLGRTINENGTVNVQPDVFNGQTLETLWRMICSIQKLENDRAQELGISPRFQYVNLKMVAAIDAQWSRYGTSKPFQSWVIYREVFEQGLTLLPADVMPQAMPRVKGMKSSLGRIEVSEPSSWISPLRNEIGEAMSELSCQPLSPMNVGSKIVSQMDLSESYEIDEEGLLMFMDFELDENIRQYNKESVNPTIAIKTYLQYGFLTSSGKGVGATDEILQNTDRFYRSGLLALSNQDLVEMASKAKKPVQEAHWELEKGPVNIETSLLGNDSQLSLALDEFLEFVA